jgi:zinc transporter
LIPAPIAHYGAELSGLVYGYAFGANGIGRPLHTDDIVSLLDECQRCGTGFAWLHFDGAHTSTRSWLSKHIELPEEFVEILNENPRSTRVEQLAQGMVAVLNDVVYSPLKSNSIQIATLWAYVGTNLLVSVRSRPLRSVDRLRSAVNAGEAFASPFALAVHLLHDQADVLAGIIRETSGWVDELEDTFLQDRLPDRSLLGTRRRDLVRLQRLLAPEPGALFRLLNRPPSWVGAGEAQDFRQSTEEFSVVLRDAAGLQERIKLLQEEIVAHIGERTNRTVFVLTAVTVIALPINLTAGLLGMNVGGIPFNQHPGGFWIVLGLLVLTTLAAGWAVLRLRVK